ncbi:protein spdB [Streptomyces sp. NPDC047315]|uniref:protein spdB n=1 Tax=Streptomyces sp. NPDC047315 TaxID=3155142 RepID=UPI0033C393F0
MTAVSMVLTLAVVMIWLGAVVPWPIALVVGLGIDGGWLAVLAYERRLAAQGDRSLLVTVVGWAFGLVATAVLVGHALTEASPAAWLAVAWLPIAAKLLWLVHSMWERTALTPAALGTIRGIQQDARDSAAVARAQLAAQAATEETRLTAVTAAGARVARVQARTAQTLTAAWGALETARQGDARTALTSVTAPVTPDVAPVWELPVWGPVDPVTPPALETGTGLTDDDLDALVDAIRHSVTPPLSYRDMAQQFRAAGHAAGETRLRAAWKRVAS